jgi:hypothetical protein
MPENDPWPRAIAAVAAYRAATSTQDPSVAFTWDEISARLTRLQRQYAELLRINQAIFEADPLAPRVSFNPATDTVVFEVGGGKMEIQLRRADPEVPVSLTGIGAMSAYPATDPNSGTPELAELKYRLEVLLENFYHSAHRVQKLVGELVGDKRSGAKAVILVRNDLVEHSAGGEPYSFAASSNGPVVRPFSASERTTHDPGLIPNALAFVDALVALLAKSSR